MIRATLRTIAGRKGSFFGGTAFMVGLVLIMVAVLTVLHILRPGRNPSIGGDNLLAGTLGVTATAGVVVAILVGSLAGSYDVAQGTMRFLVATGTRRTVLYATRTVATVLAALLAIAPALTLGVVGTVVLPHQADDGVNVGAVVEVVWAVVLYAVAYALIAMAIGTLLHANGPAIAISLFFAVGLTPLMLLVSKLSERVGELMLPNVLGRLTGTDSGAPLVTSALALVAWVGAFWLAGLVRVLRDEL